MIFIIIYVRGVYFTLREWNPRAKMLSGPSTGETNPSDITEGWTAIGIRCTRLWNYVELFWNSLSNARFSIVFYLEMKVEEEVGVQVIRSRFTPRTIIKIIPWIPLLLISCVFFRIKLFFTFEFYFNYGLLSKTARTKIFPQTSFHFGALYMYVTNIN